MDLQAERQPRSTQNTYPKRARSFLSDLSEQDRQMFYGKCVQTTLLDSRAVANILQS